MAVEEAIYSRLSGYTDLTDLLATTTSIYPEKKDGDAPSFPYVTWELVSRIQQEDAMGCAKPRPRTDQFRFHCWAESTDTYSGIARARDIATQVYNALHGFSDADILACLEVGETGVIDPSEGIYQRVVDFDITHSR